jgi:hypothetical protein
MRRFANSPNVRLEIDCGRTRLVNVQPRISHRDRATLTVVQRCLANGLQQRHGSIRLCSSFPSGSFEQRLGPRATGEPQILRALFSRSYR